MNIVLFTPDDIEKPLPLTDERALHIQKVLGKGVGDSFEAGIIGGAAGQGTISAMDDAIHFDFTPRSSGIPANPLTMLVGFPRPIQLKRMFRDLAGLGVAAVHLCGTDLGEKSYRDSTLIERGAAEKLLQEGASQAKSTHVPHLAVHINLDAALEALAPAGCLCLAADNLCPVSPLRDALAALSPEELRGRGVVCAIGAERGWTDRERRLLEEAGFVRASLGERVLRTETAATVAGALILGAMGII
jgi:RsmE family RNA methyltransferase